MTDPVVLGAGVADRLLITSMAQVVPEDVGAPSAADPKVWLVELGAVIVETDNLLKGRSPLTRWRAGAFEEIEGALLM